MHVPTEIRTRVESEVKRYVGLASKHFGKPYGVPSVHFDLRGTTAGTATGGYKVDFNSVLLMENLEAFIARTVPHEVAHCIDMLNGDNQSHGVRFDRNGRMRRAKRSVHGPTWQAIMRLFGVRDIGRCHSYDVSNAKTKTKAKFEYKCACCNRTILVSSVVHNKIRMGREYFCKRGGRANGKLTYVGSLGRVDYKVAAQVAAKRAEHKSAADEGTRFCAKIPPHMLPAAVKTQMYPMLEPKVSPTWRAPDYSSTPDGPRDFPPQGNMEKAKAIMAKYGGHLTRGQFIVRAVEAGLKTTTASTYYNQLRRRA